jgi:serine/threonine protein kinase
MTSWFWFLKGWFLSRSPPWCADTRDDNDDDDDDDYRVILYETTFSRIYGDRDNESVVHKHIFKPSLYYHEKQICKWLANKSDSIISLVGYDDTTHTLFFPRAQYDLMTWYLRYDDDDGGMSRQFLSRFLPPLIYGLEDMYRNGVEHYDIKPENVLIFGDGRVQLTDFGLAQWGASHYFPSTGTFPYMAPELTLPFTGRYVRHSMDVFSVCALAVYFIFPRLFVARDRCMTYDEYHQLAQDASFFFRKNHFPPSFYSIILHGLEFNPLKRIALPLFLQKMKRCFVEEKKFFHD